MPELYIGTIALAPVIAGLVEGAKLLGLPSRFAPILNAVLSVAGYYLVTIYLTQRPEGLQLATLGINFLVIFLSTAGLYTTAKFGVERARGAP